MRIQQHVCLQCRRNTLRRAVALRRFSRTPTATFISFTPRSPANTPDTDGALNADAPVTTTWPPNKRAVEPRLSSSLEYSLNARPSETNAADALLNLCGVLGKSDKYSRPYASKQRDLNGPGRLKETIYRQARKSVQPQGSPAATELQEILDNPSKTPKDAWEYFLCRYTDPQCPALKSPSLLDVHRVVMGTVFLNMQAALVPAWCAGTPENALPSPVQVVERYIYLEVMNAEIWRATLWFLSTEALKRLDHSADDRPGASLVETLTQLMRVWDLIFRQCHQQLNGPAKQTDWTKGAQDSGLKWSTLPSLATLRRISKEHRNFSARLASFLPDIEAPRKHQASYSALIAFDIATREGIEALLPQQLLADITPFVSFIAHLIPGARRLPGSLAASTIKSRENDSADGPNQGPLHPTNADGDIVNSDFHRQMITAGLSPSDIAALTSRVVGFTSKAWGMIGSSRVAPPEPIQELYFKRISRAYAAGKRLYIYKLWLEAFQAMTRQQKHAEPPRMASRLYNLVLEALMALRQPEQAILVWNKMVESGAVPTVKTWTAMLDGCGKARDIHGMEQMWVRMLNSGVQPDVYAWSARISGIMRAGKFEHGLRVLEEMGQTWADAHSRTAKATGGQVDTASLPAKPSTVIINGAVTSLAQHQGASQRYLARVLQWGRSFGAQPDIVTFNSVISMSLNAGDSEEAMKLLQQMERAHVQPDVATFAIILNSIFHSPAGTSAWPREVQSNKVMTVLRSLEACGMDANAHIFSTLVDGLLRRHGNEQAARAVLGYMVDKAVAIPPHVYTILMTHYFDHNDMLAVEALWTQIQAAGAHVDVVLYDRAIERYALARDTPRMMRTLARMTRAGLTPGWPALQAVAVRLAGDADWTRFEQVVSDVELGVGIASKGMRHSDENVTSRFWRTVDHLRAARRHDGV